MFKTIALSLLNRALALLMGELWQFIKDTVAVYADTTLTGDQKREAVILDVFAHCHNVGMAISDSLLNLGIEAAVQIVNGKTRG
jgi:hypothetical protein